MLEPLSEQVRECHERAAEAKGKAEATAAPALKAEFLDIERRWLALARSHTRTESLEDFTTAYTDRQRKFDERGQVNAGPDAALRLQQISTLVIQGATSTRYMTACSTRLLPQCPRTWQACRYSVPS